MATNTFAVKATDAFLSYVIDGTTNVHRLYVTEVAQPHNLSVKQSQSRLSKQIYPRAYAPGDISITGRCRSQEDYQHLALFIRKHHMALINMPRSDNFHKREGSGYNRLMKLNIESESMSIRGFIETFNIAKKGVFDPAPQYSFNFTPIFDDNNLSQSIIISRAIVKYFTSPNSPPSKSIEVYPDPDNESPLEPSNRVPDPFVDESKWGG